MSNKQQFLKFLTETSDVVFEKFNIAFGLDDWYNSVSDFREAKNLLSSRLKLHEWELTDEPELKRQEILTAFNCFLEDNKGKKESDYKLKAIGYSLGKTT
jgi:hypothetical protein